MQDVRTEFMAIKVYEAPLSLLDYVQGHTIKVWSWGIFNLDFSGRLSRTVLLHKVRVSTNAEEKYDS